MADTQQEVKKQEAVASVQPQGTPEIPQLSIADLQALLNIIDAASSRGAFRANELSNVGDCDVILLIVSEPTLSSIPPPYEYFIVNVVLVGHWP